MAIELEGLEFEITSSSTKAEKGLKGLLDTLVRIRNAVKGGIGLGTVANQIGKVADNVNRVDTDKLEKLAKACEAIKGIKGPTSLARGFERMADATAKIDVERLERMRDALQGMNGIRLPKFPTTGGNGTAPTGDTPAAPVDSDVENVGGQVEEVTERVSRLHNVLSKLDGVFSKGFSAGVGALKSLKNAAEKALVPIKVLGRLAFAPIKNAADRLASSVQTFTGKIKESVKALGRIAFYRAIRTVIKEITQGFSEGIKNLYHYSETMNGTFYQSMNKLATSAQYLKNSLGAMASPLINALAPVIDYVTDKLVDLFNLFNQFIAKLTGQTTYTAAKKVAAIWDDTKKKAKKTADEIKRYTLGFDELNILGKKNKDADTSSDNSTNYGSMFETRKIDSGIADFANKVKGLFVNQDWKGLGTLLGDKFNEAIDSIDWSGIGRKIGEWINGAIQTAYWLLDTINFTKIGSHIAEFLNNAISKIDFEYLGRLLVKKMTILPDMLIGFFVNFDWGQAASAFSSFVNGVYNEVTKWFNSHDWSNLGKVLWQKIKDVFNNLDYAGIANSFFTMLGTAIRSAAKFLGGFFGSIVSDIKAWWNKDIQGKDWKETAGNLLAAIGKGFVNIGTWVFNNIIDPFGKALLGEKWETVKGVAANVWAKIKEGWAAIANKVVTFVAAVKNTAPIWWYSVKKWWADKVGEVKAFGVSVRNTAGVWWANVQAWWKSVINPNTISTFVVNVKNSASTWWTNVKSWWKDKIDPTSAQNFIVNVANSAATWWNDVKTYWNNFMTSWRTLPVVASITNNISTLWNNIKEWWNNTVGDLWLSLKVKLPHFSVNWGTAETFFGKISYPRSLSVDWYAKGGILDDPTLFGMLGDKLLGGGEAGREAVLPLESHTEWMDTLADKVRAGMYGENVNMSEYVRQGMMDATARQNDLLREQNDLLRKIYEKELVANVSTSSIIDGLSRKNLRDGKTVVPIG